MNGAATFRVTLKTALLVGLGLHVCGCIVSREVHRPRPQPAHQLDLTGPLRMDWETEPGTDGSLHTPNSGSLFSDDKAMRVGDTVMVRVIQDSKGTKKANTDTKRSTSIAAKIKYWLGFEDELNSLTGYTQTEPEPERGTSTWEPNDLLSATSEKTFKGEGSTERNDSLEATISAIVTDVLANGSMVIYGHQTVTLNNEASVLTVQGIVRPSDVDNRNTVQSSRIANARIEFTGSGVITEEQHPGLAMRMFSWVWPF